MAYLAMLQPIEGRALPAVLAATHDREQLARLMTALISEGKRAIEHYRASDPIAAAIAAIEVRRYLDLAAVLGIDVGGTEDE